MKIAKYTIASFMGVIFLSSSVLAQTTTTVTPASGVMPPSTIPALRRVVRPAQSTVASTRAKFKTLIDSVFGSISFTTPDAFWESVDSFVLGAAGIAEKAYPVKLKGLMDYADDGDGNNPMPEPDPIPPNPGKICPTVIPRCALGENPQLGICGPSCLESQLPNPINPPYPQPIGDCNSPAALAAIADMKKVSNGLSAESFSETQRDAMGKYAQCYRSDWGNNGTISCSSNPNWTLEIWPFLGGKQQSCVHKNPNPECQAELADARIKVQTSVFTGWRANAGHDIKDGSQNCDFGLYQPSTSTSVTPSPYPIPGITPSYPITFKGGSVVNSRIEAENVCRGMSPGSGWPSDSRYTADQATCTSMGLQWGTTSYPGIGGGMGSESTYVGDANSCPGFAYSVWSNGQRVGCKLNTEQKCNNKFPDYLSRDNYKIENCSTETSPTYSSVSGYTSYGASSSTCTEKYPGYTMPMPGAPFNAKGIGQGTCFWPDWTKYIDVSGNEKFCSSTWISGCSSGSSISGTYTPPPAYPSNTGSYSGGSYTSSSMTPEQLAAAKQACTTSGGTWNDSNNYCQGGSYTPSTYSGTSYPSGSYSGTAYQPCPTGQYRNSSNTCVNMTDKPKTAYINSNSLVGNLMSTLRGMFSRP